MGTNVFVPAIRLVYFVAIVFRLTDVFVYPRCSGPRHPTGSAGLLTHTFSLDHIAEAYEVFGCPREGVIKIAIRT